MIVFISIIVQKKYHAYLIKNNFICKRSLIEFPFTTWEDRIYKAKIYHNEYSRTSSKKNFKRLWSSQYPRELLYLKFEEIWNEKINKP